VCTGGPVGALLVRQPSWAAGTRLFSSRPAVRPRRIAAGPAWAAKPRTALPLGTDAATEELEVPPPTIVEPARPRSTLIEKGLSWQETFDFGKGGAEAFQLPPVGLLQAPSTPELKRTREELQENAEIL